MSAGRSLRLEVVLKALDQASRPIKQVVGSNRQLVNNLRDTRARLKELGDAQKRVGEFRDLRRGMQATEAKARSAQERMRQLAREMQAAEKPSRALTREHQQAARAAKALTTQLDQERARLDRVRSSLSESGISTRNLAQHQRTLRSNVAATNATLSEQSRRLDAMNDRQRRIASARTKMQDARGAAAEMAIGGYAARATGSHILNDLREPMAEAKKVQNERGRIEALGLGAQATRDAEQYVRAMKSEGTTTSDNMTLMRDALSIFADEHHAQMVMPTLAKMKFANEAMFGGEDGHENEEKFMNMLKVIELRGGTKSEAAFRNEANMVQKVLSATGGRVGGDEWRNFIQTGGVAAKQMRQDAFYYQMEPLIQEMGGHQVGTGLMSAYSNAYQGKTTKRAANQMIDLGLLDRKKVVDTKIGTIKEIKPGALTGGDLFKASPLEWLEKVLLPKLAAKGITDPDRVKDMISTIFTNRTAANLFSTMYMQREQIHKNEKLNAGAYGIDDMHVLGQKQTEGKELIALAKVRNLRTEIGEQVLPVYNRALEITATILDRILGFTKEYPNFTRAVAIGTAALGVLLAVLGTLTIALAGVIGPMAIVRYGLTMLGMRGGLLSVGVRLAAASFQVLGRTLVLVGRAFLTSPIGLVAAAIALAAVLIVKYWEPIKAFFAGMFAGISSALAPLRAAFADALAPLGPALAAAKPAWDWLVSAVSTVVGWFGRLLSPASTTAGELQAAGQAGRRFGEILGAALRFLLRPLTLVARGIGALAWLFGDAMRDARAAFDGGLASIGALILNWSPVGLFYRAFAGVLSWFGIDLPAKFTTFGQSILQGFANGIASALRSLAPVLAAAKPVWDWLVSTVSTAARWFDNLSSRASAIADRLQAAGAAGSGFGYVVDSALRAALLPLTLLVRGIGALAGLFGAAMRGARAAFDGGLVGIGALILNWSPVGLFYRAFAGVLSWFGIDLPTKFTTFGRQILQGLADGITNGLSNVKTAIQSAGESVIGWFKEKLGIHSPSRVFAALGGFTMAGLEQGLREGQDGPLSTVLEVSKRIVAAGAGISITGAAIASGAPLTVDNRPPLTAASSTARAPVAPAPVTINVYAAPGMDVEALAQQVRQVIRQEQATQAARERSRLRDRD
ncbi:phage tail tape measure protein [Burkholderia cepacia]|uniref:hypothetical protein n=1 Tax=Burkholderia cepacia TaxID=292 RepID=UPI001CF2F4E0|nr:hypothetical protein [Burkholderia cepacia]MCA7941592.1 hypothetical protein [Burkholderia cepacia]